MEYEGNGNCLVLLGEVTQYQAGAPLLDETSFYLDIERREIITTDKYDFKVQTGLNWLRKDQTVRGTSFLNMAISILIVVN
jgi:hypothetical protein